MHKPTNKRIRQQLALRTALLLLLSLQQPCSSWIRSSISTTRLHCPCRLGLTSLYAKGFAKTNKKPSNNSGSNNSNESSIYSQPALYDLAFGYRDFEEQVDFLWQRHVDVTGKTPASILEVAAGPARHALTALQRHDSELKVVHCIDNALTMQEYAKDIAAHELSTVDQQDKFHYHVADMRHDTDAVGIPAASVDTAWILLGSLTHLNSNACVRACFQALHKALVKEGTLILELPHPRETFTMVECTRNGWKVPLEDTADGSDAGELAIIWGDDNDAFDPITQVRQFTVRMTLSSGTTTTNNNKQQDTVLQQVVPMRFFTAQEIEALAAATNFRVASMHGALEEGVDVNDDDAAYRLVVVLQKV